MKKIIYGLTALTMQVVTLTANANPNCPPGYTGMNCDEEIDECESSPCLTGLCVDNINGYTCICDAGWTGVNCDQPEINSCESNPCVNGNCVRNGDGYSCECEPGWTGVNCEIDVDECESNPCLHGDCRNLNNAYSCECYQGWMGTNCESNINECDPNPCANGTCDDLVGGYNCTCDPGFAGANCTTDIDECESNPCVNGLCQDLINGYVCNCLPGFTGTNCDVSADPCANDTDAPVFDAPSLDPRTVVGSCGSGLVDYQLPTATDACSQPSVSCTPVASSSAGANIVTCTATDGAGNSTQTTMTVNVLSPLRIAFASPLADDNAADDIQSDADVVNKFKVGQTIPHKVKLFSCSNTDVTASLASSVTVKLAVYTGVSGAGSNLINDLNDFSGVGDAGGLMTLNDGHFHYNLKANSGDYSSGGALYSSVVTVSYNSSPLVVSGVEDARLQSK